MIKLPRRSLPLFGDWHSGTYATCTYKCNDECHKDAPNAGAQDTFAEVAERAISRRKMLKGAAVVGMVVGFAGALEISSAERSLAQDGSQIGFTPVPPNTADTVRVPDGYEWRTFIRWGDPILPGVGGLNSDYSNVTPEQQAGAFGYNNDFVAYLPATRGGEESRSGLLWVNHEYTNPELMFAGYDPDNPTADQVDVDLNAHGGSIVEIYTGRDGGMNYRRGAPLNRRITPFTPMEITGPAAGHPLLRTSADGTGRQVLGTLNNCAGGKTPWGTILTAEENFNQYFGLREDSEVPDADDEIRLSHERYGIEFEEEVDEPEPPPVDTSTDTPVGPIEGEESEEQPDPDPIPLASGRKWERFYDRFELTLEPTEPFRFGWIVEIDPYDPTSTPKKRTALGRFKHEGAEMTVTPEGNVVAYLGDDERFDYLYKFVSDGVYDPAMSAEEAGSLLDEGTLYVAVFEDTNTGRWVPLVFGENGLTEENGFTDQGDVLIRTRLAADILEATPMDRPEDVTPDQDRPGYVYVCLTNNTDREKPEDANAANPRTPNPWGHVIEIVEDGETGTAETFSWDFLLLCGDPEDPETFYGGFDKSQVSPISAPDNSRMTPTGDLLLATDGQPGGLGINDAFHFVPLTGSERGHVQQFCTVPVGAEACGPEFTPDGRTLFLAVQHPGDGGTITEPISQYPDAGRPARPGVVSIWKSDGGVVGT